MFNLALGVFIRKSFVFLFHFCQDDGKRNPVPVDIFSQHVEVMSANDNYLFANEFEVSLHTVVKTFFLSWH